MTGTDLAKLVLECDLPCYCCDRRDDSGRFMAHGRTCPKSLVAAAKAVIKAAAIKGDPQ